MFYMKAKTFIGNQYNIKNSTLTWDYYVRKKVSGTEFFEDIF